MASDNKTKALESHRDKVSSVFGDDSDLICTDCKKEKKAHMNSRCPRCAAVSDTRFRPKENWEKHHAGAIKKYGLKYDG